MKYAVALGVGTAVGDVDATIFANTNDSHFCDFLTVAVLTRLTNTAFLHGVCHQLSVVTRDVLNKLKKPAHSISGVDKFNL